ncbi:MAG: adenosylcobinamide-GDP ribazoletransferase [Roseitalea sp.]|jgi:adenosylcobinamide-GDP ribazoletransferase|nr:adenosylcobinamide-GDP ribazoletransferase [Roseitalea sp.]MBO6722654.1 adenosylcobinamide-GDP ribazoletransferase [Roseitalea sp.]MBO6741562.1 adenosylcobinamide-GDP ribazoletransferase [Roseitalea sp.]
MTPASVMRALAFLTRLPVPARFFDRSGHAVSDDAGSFALTGALIAIPGTLVLVLAIIVGAPPPVTATIVVIATVILTGALHEDGLADMADGFGGGANKERRLEIMRDSAIGTYGVLAVAGSMLLQVTALAALCDAGALQGSGALIAAHAASRAAMVWHWSNLPPARADGVAARSGQPTGQAVNVAFVTSAAILTIVAIISLGVVTTIVALLVTMAATMGVSWLARRMIDGHTGDTIGATEQIARAMMLAGLAMAA